MSITVKQTPTYLDPSQRVQSIWPGDDSVERGASDLVAWCRDGSRDGRAGLILKSGVEPTIIEWRPLGPRERMAVDEAAILSRTAHFFEAARYGIVSVSGVRLSRERVGGCCPLTDGSLDMLSDEELRLGLPYLVALHELRKAQGENPDEPSDRLLDVSPAEVVGVHILTATFRLQKRPA